MLRRQPNGANNGSNEIKTPVKKRSGVGGKLERVAGRRSDCSWVLEAADVGLGSHA